jgi:predicted GNAT family acetyltransferase
MNTQVTTAHNEAATRFEAYVDGELASHLDYHQRDSVYNMHHTYTLDAFKGQGIASQLTEFALATVQEGGGSIIPTCWFVAEYVEKHPEYADLVHD